MLPSKTPTSYPPSPKRWATWLIFLLAIALIGLLLIILLWLKPDANAPLTASNATAHIANNPVAPTQSTISTAISPIHASTPLPKSLQGTQVDGEIIIDNNKQLVVTAGLRRLFDYFLSAQGEESLTQIEQRITDYIIRHTPQPAASQALTIFSQYIKYLQAVSELDKKPNTVNPPQTTLDLTVIQAQMQAVAELQHHYFDQKTIDAFFGEENSLNTYTLQVVQANQNPQLTQAQRDALIDKAKNTYIQSFTDPAVQRQLRQQQNVEKLLAETQQLQQQGAPQSQINAMRSKYVSPEAVKRLEQLDQSEAEFAQRLTTYKLQRSQLISKLGDIAQAQQQIVALQQSMFSPEERLRLDVLTRTP